MAEKKNEKKLLGGSRGGVEKNRLTASADASVDAVEKTRTKKNEVTSEESKE